MNIKLSILIPTTHTRRNTFLGKILDQVYSQYDDLPYHKQQQVEILLLQDNKTIMLGSKRNQLVRMAQGDYVVFVDDDDRIAPDYISTLLDATQHNTDVITFKASVSLNGEEPKDCVYTSSITADYNTESTYYRLPNHICAFKRLIALQYPFPDILYGEDSGFSKSVKNRVESEHHIDRILYYYDYNQSTTETQHHLGSNNNALIDIVILSNAVNSRFKAMTQQSIDTAFSTADGLQINVIVIEQRQGVTYNKATTHHEPSEFNYNKFANIGARIGKAKRIMISNNDVIFKKGWLHELLLRDLELMSTHCPNDIRQRGITKDEKGDQVGRHFSGWNFVISRNLWTQIDGFDEDFGFYCADNSVLEQCRELGILPTVIHNSYVQHLCSQTLRTVSKKDELTWRYVHLFNEKYNKELFINNTYFIRWKKVNLK
ncbi:MAG: hypothetical protein [Caudoviricetes sp.]|nr:MAG: hypothetical protein [Caudoviricetes sp.]